MSNVPKGSAVSHEKYSANFSVKRPSSPCAGVAASDPDLIYARCIRSKYARHREGRCPCDYARTTGGGPATDAIRSLVIAYKLLLVP